MTPDALTNWFAFVGKYPVVTMLMGATIFLFGLYCWLYPPAEIASAAKSQIPSATANPNFNFQGPSVNNFHFGSQEKAVAAAAPEPVNAKPNATYGTLHPWQITLISDSMPQYRSIVLARPQMLEPQGFSRAFENIFRTLGVEPIVTQQNPSERNQTGVRIGLVDTKKPAPADAVKMQDLIRRLGFEGDFIQLRDEALTAAKTNNGFAIYIGPRPL